ncbi:MAG: hypothetical protein ACKVPJ_00030 [Chitinophagales bacterium]
MKAAQLFIFLFIGFATVTAQFTPDLVGFQYSEFDKYKKLKVKQQVETVYDYIFTEEYVVNSITDYSETGQIMQTILNPELNSEEALDTIKYIYVYTNEGNIQSVTIHGVDILPIVYGFFYDKKGNLIESNIASAEARRINFTLDKKGRVLKAASKGAMFEYDEEGNASDEPVWIVLEETTYEWNENGLLVDERGYYRSEFSYHAIYKYDEKGSLVEENFCYDPQFPDTPSTTIQFEYDENGLLKKRSITNPDSEEKYVSLFEYAYYK